jgi:hypothetical protein
MSERFISDLIEIIECAYGFDSDDCELCDCPEWAALKVEIELLQLALSDTSQLGVQ